MINYKNYEFDVQQLTSFTKMISLSLGYLFDSLCGKIKKVAKWQANHFSEIC